MSVHIPKHMEKASFINISPKMTITLTTITLIIHILCLGQAPLSVFILIDMHDCFHCIHLKQFILSAAIFTTYLVRNFTSPLVIYYQTFHKNVYIKKYIKESMAKVYGYHILWIGLSACMHFINLYFILSNKCYMVPVIYCWMRVQGAQHHPLCDFTDEMSSYHVLLWNYITFIMLNLLHIHHLTAYSNSIL